LIVPKIYSFIRDNLVHELNEASTALIVPLGKVQLKSLPLCKRSVRLIQTAWCSHCRIPQVQMVIANLCTRLIGNTGVGLLSRRSEPELAMIELRTLVREMRP
jgi:hypothetical protein